MGTICVYTYIYIYIYIYIHIGHQVLPPRCMSGIPIGATAGTRSGVLMPCDGSRSGAVGIVGAMSGISIGAMAGTRSGVSM